MRIITRPAAEDIDRDRAAAESGNQIAVFGRSGSRPLTAVEVATLFLRGAGLYTATNHPPGPPQR